jgi:hypothetical protein
MERRKGECRWEVGSVEKRYIIPRFSSEHGAIQNREFTKNPAIWSERGSCTQEKLQPHNIPVFV